MRTIGMLSIGLLAMAGAVVAQEPQTQAPTVGTMSELMVSMTHPAANEILLAAARLPSSEADWVKVQRSAVLLSESGNVLMMRGRARDDGEWMKDARQLVDAGAAAYRAARAKDGAALTAVSEPLNNSCVNCHRQYRPNVHPRR
jgi:cytochrome c556